MKTSTRFLLAASLAGVLATPLISGMGSQTIAAEKGGDVKCYGVNKCKGSGDCGGKGHSCKGQNSCKRHGYVEMDKETCLRIDGGRLTPETEKKK